MDAIEVSTKSRPVPVKKTVGRAKRASRKTRIISTISIIIFLAGWELLGVINKSQGFFNPVFLPTPSMILHTGYDYLVAGKLFAHIGASLVRMLSGFLIGSAVAVFLGIVFTQYKAIADFINPIFNLIGPVPVYAFLPIFIIWFGIGEPSKIALIAYATFMPLLTYIVDGINSTNPVLIRSARSLGATQWQVFTKVLLKSVMPNIIVGMKVTLALSFSALVVAEMMGASTGLGFMIINAKAWFKMSDMFLAIVLIGLLYTVFHSVLTLLEKVLFQWKAEVGSAVEK